MRSFLLMSLLTVAGCAQPEANTGKPPDGGQAVAVGTADSVAIRATLDGWYTAMQAVDSAGTLAPLTPQFLLIEDTLPLSGAELLQRLQGAGTETKWTHSFSDMRTRVLGNVAWTTLKNHETSTGKDGAQCQADFLETIVFVRTGERWMIDRYHAAALHRWSCGT